MPNSNHQQQYLRSAVAEQVTRNVQAPVSTVCPISDSTKVRGVYQLRQNSTAITVDGSTNDWDLDTAGVRLRDGSVQRGERRHGRELSQGRPALPAV